MTTQERGDQWYDMDGGSVRVFDLLNRYASAPMLLAEFSPSPAIPREKTLPVAGVCAFAGVAHNKGLLLTSTFAAQGVLCPPCSLRILAAETHVRQAKRPKMASIFGHQGENTE